MKFNLLKWQSIQDRRNDLHVALMNINEELYFVRREYHKHRDSFLRGHDTRRDYPLTSIIDNDRKLSYPQLIERVEEIKSDWPNVCEEFTLPEESSAKPALIALYNRLLDLKRLEQRYDLVQSEWKSYGQSFNTLQEFATKHTKISSQIVSPVN
ncbi:hypothetical protein AU255_09215 [Methyloprofundus sedimenti]|uniref:Uncharacterized protein n=1 Tax=Methyloprofundus sedimenti TaxID=1420851 RepID=A0A1V8M924_9GAMM|nr:hypothetical protein [Methyloprofundus sedimenti]OQK18017.1 hypothetical protein AU255_09215 [Methyloprofundus sedimenti]